MSPVRAVPIALLAAALIPVSLASQQETFTLIPEPDAPDEWLKVSSEHFILFGNRPREELVEAAVELERLRDVLSRMAPEESVHSFLPARLYLFRNAASFAPFRLPGSSAMDAGYLIPGEEASYGAFVGGRPSYLVLKQYVRDFFDRRLPGLPAWLRIGFAEYYSNFEADDSEARIGLPIRGHLRWLARSSADLLPTAELVTMEPSELETGAPALQVAEASSRAASSSSASDEELFDRLFEVAASPYESQSWATVHYLMGGDEAWRGRIADYIHRLQRGEDPAAAFRNAFETDFETFDRTLADYIRGESFPYLRVPAESRGSLPLAAEPLTPAATSFHLGDLLVRLGPSHRAAARTRLRRAVELDPEHGPTWAALGRIAEDEGDHEAALEAYEEALSLSPDDFGVQLRYGQARLRSLAGRRASDEEGQTAVAAAREAFRRATELRPGSGEAWAGLGHAGVLSPEPDPEAVTALEQALELLPPGRSDVLYNLLLARARLGDAAGVDRALADLRAADADDSLLLRGREVRLQLTLREAHRFATSDRKDDAAVLLSVVRAETTNPAVAEQAEDLLDKLDRAEAHNRFAEGYMEAVRLYHEGELDAAAAAVEAMLAEAPPGRQVETLEDLRERIEMDRP